MRDYSEISIAEVGENQFKVQLPPISLELGKRCRLNPSYQYSGIEASVVYIAGFINNSEYIDNKELYPDITEYLKVEHMTLEEEVVPPDTWVKYRYLRNDLEENYLPLEIFVSHMSMV